MAAVQRLFTKSMGKKSFCFGVLIYIFGPTVSRTDNESKERVKTCIGFK